MWNIIIDNIWDPLFSYDFMRRALVSLFILSLSAPVAGVFLSLRKLSLSGDALSHAILPGAATGYLLKGLSVTAMTIGGILAGTLVIFMSALFSRLSRNTEDSSLAVFYLVSLALGVLIISLSGSGVDLMSFLFDCLSIPRYCGSIPRERHLLRTGTLFTAMSLKTSYNL